MSLITLNDGFSIPNSDSAPGRSPTSRHATVSPKPWRSDTAISTRRRCTATRAASAGRSRRVASPRGALRHHQAQQQQPRARPGHLVAGRFTGAPRPRPCRPVPHPLAATRDRHRLRRHLERNDHRSGHRANAVDRRLQLHRREPPAHHRTRLGGTCGQPDRGAPVPGAERPARRRRRVGYRHRGMVTVGDGHRLRGSAARRHRRTRWASGIGHRHRLAICSAATSSSPRRRAPLESGKTSRRKTFNSTPRPSPRSMLSTRVGASGPIR